MGELIAALLALVVVGTPAPDALDGTPGADRVRWQNSQSSWP